MAQLNDCLSDEELTSLLQGEELGERRDVVMVHLDRCPGCRMVLSEAAQHLDSRPESATWARSVVVVAACVVVLLTIWWLRAS